MDRAVGRLVVPFDGHCPVCVAARDWLVRSPQCVPLTLVDAYGSEARAYAHVPWIRRELVVISDRGEVWAGPAAFLVCLWALARWRWLALLALEAPLLPIAEVFFRALSAGRGSLGGLLGAPACEHGTCGVPLTTGPYR
jgi:predicted DCC family thiol-disulfide oxidoreductase YuxK